MRVVVVMPAYNEAEGIAEFLRELDACLRAWEPSFVVVDDASRDGTAQAARAAGEAESLAHGDIRVHVDVQVVANPVNRGHGPSTLTALRLGLQSGADAIVAIDGDGQFTGADVARVVQALQDGNSDSADSADSADNADSEIDVDGADGAIEVVGLDVVEGVRTSRGDALYRRATSQVTRALVWSRCGAWPQDANTPLRAYRPDALRTLLAQVPQDAMTPNLIISALCRRQRMRIAMVPVASRPRRGSTAQGSTWGSRRASLPSRRFIAFCAKAAGQWIRL